MQVLADPGVTSRRLREVCLRAHLTKQRERGIGELSENAVDTFVYIELCLSEWVVSVLELVVPQRVRVDCQVEAVHLVDELRTVVCDRG